MTHAPVRLLLPGSLAGLAEDIRQSFSRAVPGARVSFHPFGPTGQLAAEVLGGAPADVFVSANLRYMDDLRRAGLVRDPAVLAGNRLCIVTAEPGGGVAVLEDLARPGVRVVTPQSETDPCGQYVVALFARAGLTERMGAKEAAGELFHSGGSAELPAFLTQGRADAGILYQSEAVSLERVRLVELPPSLDLRDVIIFTIGAVGRPEPSRLARRLVAHLTGPAGRELLVGKGFLPGPTEPAAR